MCYKSYGARSTKSSTYANEENKNNNIKYQQNNVINEKNNIEDTKYYYQKKENMEKYLDENFIKFKEEFELLDYVGGGSAGHVFKAKKMKGNYKNILAIKFCINDNQKESKNNNYLEVGIMKKLHHKNINPILAFYKMNKNSFFSVQEYMKYGNLKYFISTLLRRKKLSETCVLYFAKQILESLEYLNRCKILHFDIKPENILIDSELNPRLIDFSVSCSFAEYNKNDVVKFPFVGTSKYIAPEIIKRSEMTIKDGEKIDLYSLGVTLYYLLFGVFPYNLNQVKGKNYEEILKKIETEKLEFPKDDKVSDMLKDFLNKLLEKDFAKE